MKNYLNNPLTVNSSAKSIFLASPLRGAFSVVQFCTFHETKYILVTSIFVSLSATFFFVCLPISSLKQTFFRHFIISLVVVGSGVVFGEYF